MIPQMGISKQLIDLKDGTYDTLHEIKIEMDYDTREYEMEPIISIIRNHQKSYRTNVETEFNFYNGYVSVCTPVIEVYGIRLKETRDKIVDEIKDLMRWTDANQMP